MAGAWVNYTGLTKFHIRLGRRKPYNATKGGGLDLYRAALRFGEALGTSRFPELDRAVDFAGFWQRCLKPMPLSEPMPWLDREGVVVR